MKVLIVKNRVRVDISDDIQNAFIYLSQKTPLKFDLSYMETDFDLSFKPFMPNLIGTTGTKDKLAPLMKESYDVVIFFYGIEDSFEQGKITGWSFWEGVNGAEYIEIPTSPIADTIKWIQGAITHEFIHALCKSVNRRGVFLQDEMDITKDGQMYLHNDDPNHPDGNYARTLKSLSVYWNMFTFPTTYRYFSQKELDKFKLKPELWKLLDDARHIAGVPFKINSGLRTKEQNEKSGGVEDSAHLVGEACDIACADSAVRWKIVNALLRVGFNRIGINNTFIHADISKSHPHEVIWLY